VAIGTDNLSKQVQADLLGHDINSEGVLIKKSSDLAPYVAIGFRSEMSNGKFRFVWLYKGKFQPVEQTYQTKEGTPAFQTPTINGTFMRRDFDNQWKAQVDEGEEGVDPAVNQNWLSAVYEETPEI
jgi:phi13 family phage major tail protein